MKKKKWVKVTQAFIPAIAVAVGAAYGLEQTAVSTLTQAGGAVLGGVVTAIGVFAGQKAVEKKKRKY